MTDFKQRMLHARMFLTGRCTRCNKYNEEMIHDFGKMEFAKLHRMLDSTDFYTRNLTCSACGTSYIPKEYILRESGEAFGKSMDLFRQEVRLMSPAESQMVSEIKTGHARRWEIYEEKKQEFWDAYTSYALENWREAVSELLRSEIESATSGKWKTEQQARKEVAERFKTAAERESFWMKANQEYINLILDIGAMGWAAMETAKKYGLNRTRFVMLNFPIDEALEQKRIMHVGELYRGDKKNSDILLKHLTKITEINGHLTRELTEEFYRYEALKQEVAVLQEKLAKERNAIRSLSDAAAQTEQTGRSAADVQKIRELKSFVGELLQELRRKGKEEAEDADTADADIPEWIEADHVGNEAPSIADLSILEGLQIGLIGGHRAKALTGIYPCQIVTHEARQLDNKFYEVLASDVLVVLTRFVSHAAMWEAKGHAIANDKPIIYVRELNIDRILNQVAEQLAKEGI